MNSVIISQNIGLLYKTFSSKKKERFDIILEPLQAIIQLALMRFCPIGTKLTIHDNLLEIQRPTYTQGIMRWYNNDNKDDLFYLFNVCKRFGLFYRDLREVREIVENDNDELIEANLYSLLIESASKGLDKLSQTYNSVEKISLLHTLQLYKMILLKPNIFENKVEEKEEMEENNGGMIDVDLNSCFGSVVDVGSNITGEECGISLGGGLAPGNASAIYNANINDIDIGDSISVALSKKSSSKKNGFIGSKNSNNIDNIFINIKNIYSKELLNIILNLFIVLVKNEDNDCDCYIDGINSILNNTNCQIRKWISDNIVF